LRIAQGSVGFLSATETLNKASSRAADISIASFPNTLSFGPLVLSILRCDGVVTGRAVNRKVINQTSIYHSSPPLCSYAVPQTWLCPNMPDVGPIQCMLRPYIDRWSDTCSIVIQLRLDKLCSFLCHPTPNHQNPSVLLSKRLAVLEGQVLAQCILQRFLSKQFVQDLSDIVHKYEFDSLLDTWWDVLVNIGFAGCWNDQLWRTNISSVRPKNRLSANVLLMPARCAARIFSFKPPTGRTWPRSVISPVIAETDRA
jgi:hypothetical protein